MSKSLLETVSTGTIQGTYDPKFEQVAEQFVENFTKNNELGASVALTLEGETVVDLWGGSAEEGTDRPWEKDTVSIIWSSTKAATAICFHMLASQGKINLNAPVSKYWPEYAQKGKDTTTVRMVLAHQCGIGAVSQLVKPDGFYDWDYMVKLVEHQAPYYPPETKHGYGGFMFAFVAGEIFRRAAGETIGTFFQRKVAQPLGLQFWIGLPSDIKPSIAKMELAPAPAENAPVGDFFLNMADPNSVQAQMFNLGNFMNPDETGFDGKKARAAEIPSANGLSNGRGIAGMFTPFANGGKLDDIEFVNSDQLLKMIVTESAGLDHSLCYHTNFSLGFFKSIDNRYRTLGNQDSFIIGERAFGHPGMGGIAGFADPTEKLSFGYTMNRMGPGTLLNERGQGLVDASYKSLGYRSNASGVWIK